MSISKFSEFNVYFTFWMSVMMGSSSSGSLARKCFSMVEYRLNSTFLGSIITSFSCDGCFLYSREVMMAFNPTDLP